MLLIGVYKEGGSSMMRYLLFTLILSGLLFCQIGCNSQQQPKTTESVAQSQTRIYEVFGMNCPGCHGGLEKLVKKIPAVKDARANWIKKQIHITLKPGAQLNDEDIYDAIRRANFTPGKRIK